MNLRISQKAAQRIMALGEGKAENPFLRITIQSGGCFGFQYIFALDTALGEGDQVFQQEEARVVIDDISLGFLKDAELDYEEDLMGSTFVIRNPNALGSCGCGTSFSV